MRVALVSDWYAPRMGGIETYLDGLARHLMAAGHQVQVLTPMPGDTSVNGVAVQRLCEPGTTGGYRFPPPHHSSNGRDFLYLIDLFAGANRPRAVRRAREALEQGSFDVVHVHLGNTPFSYIVVNICRSLGLPVVATFHSVLSPVERPFAALAGNVLDCRSWADSVVLSAVSTAAVENRRVMFGPAPFRILHNAMDLERTSAIQASRSLSSAGETIELVSLTRLHPRKRPQLLLEAVDQARKLSPKGARYRLRIAGEGPLRSQLERRIEALGLQGVVHLLGQVDRDAVHDLLRHADLFLSATKLESFGIAALEARSSGVPVLAMRDAGSTDFLTHGVDSLLVADDAAFATALADYLSSASLRADLAHGALSPVSGFSWPDLIAGCQKLYEEALKRRQSQ